jgi:hypothetical protein
VLALPRGTAPGAAFGLARACDAGHARRRPACGAGASLRPARLSAAPLRPLALGEVERRFADRFPGAIARLTDGQQVFVMRHVDAPTRMLHPAVDCFRAIGDRIAQERLERDAQQRLWRCLTAKRKGGQKIRVCERIVDVGGAAVTLARAVE